MKYKGVTVLIGIWIVLWATAAYADVGDPSTASLVGWAIAAAGAVTPLGTILLGTGRKIGQAQAEQEALKKRVEELTSNIAELARERRVEQAASLAESRALREAITDSAKTLRDEHAEESRAMRAEFLAAIDRLGEKMLPKETSVLQIGGALSQMRADVIREVAERVVPGIMREFVAQVVPLLVNLRSSAPPLPTFSPPPGPIPGG